MCRKRSRFWADDRGVSSVEAGLLAALVALAVVVVAANVGEQLASTLDQASEALGGSGQAKYRISKS